MEPYFSTDTVTLYHGSALEVLKGLPDESVNCVVTSPPYFGLRAYGTEAQVWQNGQPLCGGAHRWGDEIPGRKQTGGMNSSTLGAASGGHAISLEGIRRTIERQTVSDPPASSFCQSCGAWRGELGLEPTPELYVEHLVSIFREVRRVLRDDGTLWVNIGDSYNADGRKGRAHMGQGKNSGYSAWVNKQMEGTKPKDLLGIPWMLAFALRADGYYLRSDIIWHKPNPMPESVTDRPTKAHEYIFLLSKSDRYYYDADAIREPNVSAEQYEHTTKYAKVYDNHTNGAAANGQPGNVNNVGIHSRPGRPGRNRRSVWTVATKPFPDAHFAVFPPELIEPCIKAGCPEGGTVLDPFSGSGTTLAVADRLGRRAVGIDLKEEYCRMAVGRFKQNSLPFAVNQVEQGESNFQLPVLDGMAAGTNGD